MTSEILRLIRTRGSIASLLTVAAGALILAAGFITDPSGVNAELGRPSAVQAEAVARTLAQLDESDLLAIEALPRHDAIDVARVTR
jgi:hypothetical protein